MQLTDAQLTPLAERVPGGVLRLEPLPGGASSLTFLAYTAGDRFILKVAPPGLPPVRNRDVLRQSGLLRRLARVTSVPVPEVLFEVNADGPDAPPFFGMSFVDGESVEPILDAVPALPPTPVLAARFLTAARLLAELHRAPVAALAPDEPAEVDLAGEVARWARALDSVPEAMRPRAPECRDALLETLPAPAPPSVLHGDFRLGNMLCRGETVAAVIDWEIWSVGDPRVDLAWTRTFTHPDRLPTAVRVVDGLPDAGAVLAVYGENVADLAWFDALARFKQAAVTALIVKHNARRPDPDPTLVAAEPAVARSIAASLTLLSRA